MTITSKDFKDWLEHPCTQFLQKWVEKDRDELKQSAVDMVYHNFNKTDAQSGAVKIFGICQGLDRILELFKWSNQQVIEEHEMVLLSEDERKEVEDYIGQLIKFVYDKGGDA